MKVFNSMIKQASYFKVLMAAWLARGKKNYYSKVLDLQFKLDLNCFVDFRIYYNGVFQEDIVSAIRTLLKKYNVDTFIDIGSHIGQMSLLVSKSYPDVEIISIEPSAKNRKRQQENMLLNQLDYTILPFAISDYEGKGNLYQPKKAYAKEYFKFNDGRFSLLPSNDTSVDTDQMVQIVTMDSVLKEIPKVGRLLVKLDVEGSELEVIKGGLTTLSNSKVALIMELSALVYPKKCQKIIKLMMEHNFKMYNLQLEEMESSQLKGNTDVIFMNYPK